MADYCRANGNCNRSFVDAWRRQAAGARFLVEFDNSQRIVQDPPALAQFKRLTLKTVEQKFMKRYPRSNLRFAAANSHSIAANERSSISSPKTSHILKACFL
jgi:hypothetical protein